MQSLMSYWRKHNLVSPAKSLRAVSKSQTAKWTEASVRAATPPAVCLRIRPARVLAYLAAGGMAEVYKARKESKPWQSGQIIGCAGFPVLMFRTLIL